MERVSEKKHEEISEGFAEVPELNEPWAEAEAWNRVTVSE